MRIEISENVRRFNWAVEVADGAFPKCLAIENVERLIEFLDDDPSAPAELANEIRAAWVDLQ